MRFTRTFPVLAISTSTPPTSRCSSAFSGARSGSVALIVVTQEPAELWIRHGAAAGVAVERVAPQRLHGESARAEVDARRCALARGDPRALVAVLGAA